MSVELMTEKVLDSGLWCKEDGNLVFHPVDFNGSVINSHRFGFTPEPIELPEVTVGQMKSIASELPDYFDLLKTTACLPKTGTSSQYKGLDPTNWSPPPVTMIDAMITAQGEVKIAEIDVINPRGLGYLAMYGLLHGESIITPAMTAVLKAISETGQDLSLLYGTMQGFYKQYFKILSDRLKGDGIKCDIVSEADIILGDDGLPRLGQSPWDPKLLLDFPVLQKKSRKSYGQPSKWIVDSLNAGELTTLYPALPELSSKLLLAMAYEGNIFEGYLAETQLCEQKDQAQKLLDTGGYCIKAAVSSGMKGLWLPDSNLQPSALPVVAQELIDDQKVIDLTYANGGDKSWKNGRFLARLSLFVGSEGTLLAADITAQPYEGKIKGIHGNPDCVLAPVSL